MRNIYAWGFGATYIRDLMVASFNTVEDSTAGGRLNKKDGLTRYGDSHVKDKTS